MQQLPGCKVAYPVTYSSSGFGIQNITTPDD
jgi:hypothetical protein